MGWTLWIGHCGSVAELVAAGRLVLVGCCGSVAVGRSLWPVCWALWVGRCKSVGCCVLVIVG